MRRLAIEAWRRAGAMGLVSPDAASSDSPDLAHLLQQLREAGIARLPAMRLATAVSPSTAEAEKVLRFVIAALDASPVPSYEWPAVSRVLDADQLGALLNISPASLRRYAAGERKTPDEVAARLHHLALIVGDLAGAYNDVGVRRWFHRARTALNGRTPAALLSGDWNPDEEEPRKVRELARSLVTMSAT
ncbi:MAG TPA: hypothetical protein VMO26_19610 [Vicinamibacterales bacterium]|nr:hypothetical protein [Vicinamibacterales bacterium]